MNCVECSAMPACDSAPVRRITWQQVWEAFVYCPAVRRQRRRARYAARLANSLRHRRQ